MLSNHCHIRLFLFIRMKLRKNQVDIVPNVKELTKKAFMLNNGEKLDDGLQKHMSEKHLRVKN